MKRLFDCIPDWVLEILAWAVFLGIVALLVGVGGGSGCEGQPGPYAC